MTIYLFFHFHLNTSFNEFSVQSMNKTQCSHCAGQGALGYETSPGCYTYTGECRACDGSGEVEAEPEATDPCIRLAADQEFRRMMADHTGERPVFVALAVAKCLAPEEAYRPGPCHCDNCALPMVVAK